MLTHRPLPARGSWSQLPFLYLQPCLFPECCSMPTSPAGAASAKKWLQSQAKSPAGKKVAVSMSPPGCVPSPDGQCMAAAAAAAAAAACILSACILSACILSAFTLPALLPSQRLMRVILCRQVSLQVQGLPGRPWHARQRLQGRGRRCRRRCPLPRLPVPALLPRGRGWRHRHRHGARAALLCHTLPATPCHPAASQPCHHCMPNNMPRPPLASQQPS